MKIRSLDWKKNLVKMQNLDAFSKSISTHCAPDSSAFVRYTYECIKII